MKKYLIPLALVLTLNSCSFFAFQQNIFVERPPEEISKQFNTQGITAFNQKNYPNAIALFTEAIKVDANNAHVFYFNRGMAYGELKDYKNAIHDYRKVLETQPQTVPVLYNLAIAHSFLNEFDEAIDTSSRAILIDPTYAAAYGNLSWNYLFKKDYQMALLKALQAIEINPNMVWAYTNVGHAYLFLGQYHLALKAYQASRLPEVVLSDFKDMKQAGLFHQDMQKVEMIIKKQMNTSAAARGS